MPATAELPRTTTTVTPLNIRLSAPDGTVLPALEHGVDELRCVVCGRPFDFAAGQTAVVLRHTAYGYDLAHDGACLAAAREQIFAEPGYDRVAFGRDPERRRILAAAPGAGWSAVMAVPGRSPSACGGPTVRLERLRWWVLVEHADGSRRVEGLIRDDEWLDEPGGAEFPEASGSRRWFGYASPEERVLANLRKQIA